MMEMPHGGISPIAIGKEGSAPPPRELLKKLAQSFH